MIPGLRHRFERSPQLVRAKGSWEGRRLEIAHLVPEDRSDKNQLRERE